MCKCPNSYCECCPYPFEAQLQNIIDPYSGDTCPEFGCSPEDAIYKAQWAYRQLLKRSLNGKEMIK